MEYTIGIGIIIGLIIFSTNWIYSSNYFSKSQKNVLIMLLIFAPAQWILAIIFWLWNKHCENEIGFSIDKTEKQINDLKILNSKSVLTDDEFRSKSKEVLEKLKTKKVKNSEEYKSLAKLKFDGILSESEFYNKTKLLEARSNEQNSTHSFFENSLNSHKKEYYDFSVSNKQIMFITIIGILVVISLLIFS